MRDKKLICEIPAALWQDAFGASDYDLHVRQWRARHSSVFAPDSVIDDKGVETKFEPRTQVDFVSAVAALLRPAEDAVGELAPLNHRTYEKIASELANTFAQPLPDTWAFENGADVATPKFYEDNENPSLPPVVEFDSTATRATFAPAEIPADSPLVQPFPDFSEVQIRTAKNPKLAGLLSSLRLMRRNNLRLQLKGDEIREQNRGYKTEHASEIKEQEKRSYEENKLVILARNKDYQVTNKDPINNRRSANKYHKPFVCIDAEGMTYSDGPHANTVTIDGVDYRNHKIFLIGAGGWKRAHTATELNKTQDLSRTQGEDLPFNWLENPDKSPLEPREIIEWLLSLEAIYGDVNFVSFGFSYDATQILMALPFDRAKEIATKKSRKTKKPIKHPTLCGKYAIDYLKGKWLKIWELRDGDHPYKDKIRNGKLVTGRHGVPAKELDYTRKIIIEDFLGFYQSGFVKVLKPLVKKGYVEGAVFKTIEKQKANRSQFCDEPFEDIKHYCGLELVCASKALVVLRDGFDRMGIKLTSWSGAGSAAAALIKKEKLKKDHYFDTIKTLNPDPEQIAAHHAYFGRRIELLKQGVTDKPYSVTILFPLIPQPCRICQA